MKGDFWWGYTTEHFLKEIQFLHAGPDLAILFMSAKGRNVSKRHRKSHSGKCPY